MSDSTHINDMTTEQKPFIEVVEQGKPWDLFPTLMILALIGVAVSLTASAVLFGFYLESLMTDSSLTFKAYVKTVDLKNSVILGTTQGMGTVVALAIVFLFAWKKTGITISDYLGLKTPKIRDFFIWLGLLFLFMVAIKFLSLYIEQDKKSSEFTINLVKNSQHFWIIFLTVAVAAPLLEEFVMRGFLFKGLLHAKLTDVIAFSMIGIISYMFFLRMKHIISVGHWMIISIPLTLIMAAALYYVIYWLYKKFQSKQVLGAVGTVILTSVFWALLHTQYGWFNIVVIMGLGVLFGMARLITGSIYVPIFLHAAQNGLAVLAVSAMLAEKAASGG